jgi:hypothetical protein
MWAKGRASRAAAIAVSAEVADPAPSFQPANAATRIGERSSGVSASKMSESDWAIPRIYLPSASAINIVVWRPMR